MTSRIPDPESPLEAEGIPDLSDALPGKRITGDAQEELEPPHDYPIAVDDFGTTAAEQHDGEPLDRRLARELPDVATGGEAHLGQLVADREGGTNKEQDEWAADVGGQGDLSPEELAMHEESPPP